MKPNTAVKIIKGAHKGKQGKIGVNRPSNGHQRGKVPVIVGHKNDIYWVQPDWVVSNEAPVKTEIEVLGNVEETTVDSWESSELPKTSELPVMVSNEAMMIDVDVPVSEVLVELPDIIEAPNTVDENFANHVFISSIPPEKHDIKPGKQWIDPRLVNIKGGTQTRETPDVYQVVVSKVQEYSDTMRECLWDWYREPLPVAFVDSLGNIVAGDCHHRIAASIASERMIYIDIRQGEKIDAVLFSCRANTDHGLPLRPKDQRRRVEMLLDVVENLPEEKSRELLKIVPDITEVELQRAYGGRWSARVIAKYLKMNASGHRTVINILQERKRAALFVEENLQVDDYVRVFDDGWVGKIHELSRRKGVFIKPVSKTCSNGKFTEGNYIEPELLEKIDNSSDIEVLTAISEATSKGELRSVSEELKKKAEELGVPFDGLPEAPHIEGDPATLEAPHAVVTLTENNFDIVVEVENSVEFLTDEEVERIWKAISGRIQPKEHVNA